MKRVKPESAEPVSARIATHTLMPRLMRQGSPSRIVATVSRFAAAMLLAAALAPGARAEVNPVKLIVIDCEATSLMSREFRALGSGPDINNSGIIAFTDRNALYRYYVDFFVLEELVNVEEPVSTGEVIAEFGDRVHINGQGCVAWQAGVQDVHPNPACNPVILECGETGPGGCIRIVSITNALLRAGDPGSCSQADGTAVLLLHEGSSGGPQEFVDFDILDDNRVALVLGVGGAEPNEIVLVDVGSLVTYVTRDGPAPEGAGTYGCFPQTNGDAFFRVTTGLAEPVGFNAKIKDAGQCALWTLVSELGSGSVVNCDAIPGFFQGGKLETKPDMGCVECFGANESSVVHAVRLDSDPSVCIGGSGVTALVETDVVGDTTAILAKTQQQYVTLDCGWLCSIGVPSVRPELSASDFPSAPPCRFVEGVAVFRGRYHPTRAQCAGAKEAIFLCTGPDEVYAMVEEGDLLPGSHNSLKYVDFGDPVVNARGEVVFWASHDGACPEPECGGIFVVNLDDFLRQNPDPCPPDLNNDGMVDILDWLIMFGSWGTCPVGDPCCADLNNNGVVDNADLDILMDCWGPCPCSSCPTGPGPGVGSV